VIYTKGCIEQGEAWFQQYMIPVVGVIVGVAVILVRIFYLPACLFFLRVFFYLFNYLLSL